MTILETRKVQVYDFENRDGETKYGFVMKFQEQDEVYTPYLTNSRASIGLFIDPIEFAELIQDNGAKYMVTPNAIVFDDAESADVAADILAEILRKKSLSYVEFTLEEFAENNYFGKKQWFLDQLRQPTQCADSDVPDDILESAYLVFMAIRNSSLYATIYGGNEDKTRSIVSYDLHTGDLESDEGQVINIRDVDGLNIVLPVDLGSWYRSSIKQEVLN